jgi:RNA polymerase sigma factor (sigma-70 family)
MMVGVPGGTRLGDRTAVARDEAFLQAAHRDLDRAYRLAGLILGSADDAADVTHDALIKAWRGRAGLRDPARFTAWFDRILVNLCRDRLRRGRRVRFIPIDDAPLGVIAADPFRRVLDDDELGRAMGGLDGEARVLVNLRYWADLTVEDIAARLDVPAGTVKSRLHRALGHMRERLAADAREESA